MTKWPMVPLGDVLQLQRRWVKVDPLATYEEIGVRCFGNGIFHKAPIDGSTLGDKRVLRIEPGDLVFNNVFAWEGAVAVASEAEAGKIGSHRFVTYTADHSRCSVDYLRWFFKSEPGLEVLRRVSPGSAGRNRTMSLDQLPEQKVPLPPLKEQQSLVDYLDALIAKVDEATNLRNEADSEAAALEASWANALFNGPHAAEWLIRPLGELAEIQSGVTLGRSLSGSTIRRPYLRVANVQDGHLDLAVIKEVEIRTDEVDKWNLVEGDVLLTEGGDWDKLGRGTVWRGEIPGCIHQNHIFRVRVDSSVLMPDFLSLQTASPYGRGYFQSASKQTTNLASINQRQLKAFPVLIPSIQEQAVMLRHAVKLRESLNLSKDVRNDIRRELAAIIPTVLNQAFNGDAG